MKTKLLLLSLGLVFLFSCKKDETEAIGGSQSAIGALNNTFSATGLPGAQNFSAKVTALENGISTLTWSASITNTSSLAVLSALSGSVNNGISFSRTSKYKITSEGIESVYPEGNLICVKYDAKVGDTWTQSGKSRSVSRTVSSVSSTDDFYWNNLQIKAIKVDETGRGLPGVSKIQSIYNHKFGIVEIVVYMEDGTIIPINIYSKNIN